jgi:hypothetical protein
MLKKAFAQMSEVSVRVSCGRYTLVHLDNVHVLPRDLFACQGAEHDPRCVTAANRRDEAAALGNGCPCFRRDHRGRFSGD